MEVEEPNDEMSTRRIHFYKRLEFTLHKKPYMQPPYRKGDNGLPMLLMTYGDIDMESDFEKVKKTLYKEVLRTRNLNIHSSSFFNYYNADSRRSFILKRSIVHTITIP